MQFPEYQPLKISLPQISGLKSDGKVIAFGGTLITAKLPEAAIGDLCEISTKTGHILAQVTSFQDSNVKLAPLDPAQGIAPGAAIRNTGMPLTIRCNGDLLGKVLDATGKELQIAPTNHKEKHEQIIFVNREPPAALSRPLIEKQLMTGVKCIDTLTPIGYGQRIGLFAGPGVGKSTLMGMIANKCEADVCVIALVGERSREVPDFIQQTLGDCMKKSVVVVATSDESAARRMLAPLTATAIAEHYRDQGKNVLLLVDSLTRTARALREVGLASGEIPVRQGYPSSVYTELPKLLERAGTDAHGSITGIYTVLTQADQSQDPLAEELRSLLDGHIILDPQIAENGLFPAFDAAASLSRLQSQLQSREVLAESRLIKKAAACIKSNKEILLFGGTPDAELEAALGVEDDIHQLIAQSPYDDHSDAPSPKAIAEKYVALLQQAKAKRGQM